LKIGKHGDRERVSNERVNLIKTRFIQVRNAKVKPHWTTNIHAFKNEGQEGKTGFFWGWGRGEGIEI
jgi:hypothetical protein